MPENDWPVRVFDEKRPNGGGSGLLIDTRRVLTCAHVVEGMARPTVAFPARPDLDDLPATAEIAKRWERGDDTGDLAVLTLPSEVPIRPARFAPHHMLDLGLRDLVAIGFPATADGRGRVASVTATTSQYLLQGEWMQLESAREFGPNVGKGYSGGAVALRSTLEVVGMITAADRADRLGLMLPLPKLVEYHEGLADLMPLGPISADGHRALRALLSGRLLANPDAAYRHAVDDVLIPLPPDSPNRDLAYAVARYIAEELFLDDSGETVRAALARLCLRVADEVSDRHTVVGLRSWVAQHCGQQAADRRPQDRLLSPQRVSVRLSRSGAGANSRLLEVAVRRDGEQPDCVVSERVPSGRVQNRVQDLLPTVIDEHVPPESALIVEFVLPRMWLSKPVDEWTLGRRGTVRIGWRHPVVVRDLARVRDRELSLRWARMAASASAAAVHWVSCRDATTDQQIAAALAEHSDRVVLALASPPTPIGTSPVLRAGFDSGMPAILWPRVACQQHDESAPCHGQRFEAAVSERLTTFLAHAAIRDLPELVRRLRAAAGQVPDAELHCGRALTLLWDPPEQVVPPFRLAMAD
ncbi:VMAP-C domain-containing protein [Micromonospora sp. SCSIO 07396]